MHTLKAMVPVTLLIAAFVLCTAAAYGTQEYMKKEGVKSCTTCHSKIETGKGAMAKNLNATGKCYGENSHSLAKCKVPDKK